MKLSIEHKDRIEKELSLFYSPNSRPFLLKEVGTPKFEKELRDYISTRDEGIITRKGEALNDYKLEWIQDIIRKENPKFKIQCSTLSEVEFGTHPYTNYALWGNRNYPNEEKPYYLFNHISQNPKTTKYILATAKQTKLRDSILNRVSYLKNGIIRYVGNGDEYLDSQELLNLYDSSYFSIVLETTYNFNRYIGNCILFSEKTPIAFHTKTLPIIFGNKFLNKNLQQLGWFTMNDWFGLEDTTDTSESKLVKIIKKIDGMSIKEIENLYGMFSSRIQSNLNLQNELFKLNKKYLAD